MVSKRRAPEAASSEREALSRERIARAALRLIDAGGVEALSTRRLGRELGVEAMSLYHHVAGKAGLLDAVAELLVAEVDLAPALAKRAWKERLRAYARAYRAVAERHPRAFPLLAMRRLTTARALEFVEAVVGTLRGAGLDARSSAYAFRQLGYFIHGAALAEIATRGEWPGGATASDAPALPDAEAFPRTAEASVYFAPEHFDRIFESGLEALLASIERLAKRGVRGAAP